MSKLRAAAAATALVAASSLAGTQPAAGAITYFAETTPPSAAYAGSGAQPLVGDFDGDEIADVFFYRPGSASELMKRGRSDRTFQTASVGLNVSGTYQPLVGDFDGDEITDIFWYAPGAANDYLWTFHSGGSHTSTPISVNGSYRPFVGDFHSSDAQGRDDIFWYAPGTTPDFLWRSTGGGAFLSIYRPVNGTYEPIVGYFTPTSSSGGSTDGTLDIFWYTRTPGGDSLWNGNGSGGFTSKAYWAPSHAEAYVGLFDGYGVSDILWDRPASADAVWLADPDLLDFTSHPTSIPLGAQPILGPFQIVPENIVLWSPDGPDTMWFPQGEPGVWDHTELYNNSDMGPGYTPLAGDFDGDGSTDLYWLDPTSNPDHVWWGPNPDA